MIDTILEDPEDQPDLETSIQNLKNGIHDSSSSHSNSYYSDGEIELEMLREDGTINNQQEVEHISSHSNSYYSDGTINNQQEVKHISSHSNSYYSDGEIEEQLYNNANEIYIGESKQFKAKHIS